MMTGWGFIEPSKQCLRMVPVENKTPYRPPTIVKDIPEDIRRKIAQDTRPVATIAEEYGVTRWTVQQVTSEMGIKRKGGGRGQFVSDHLRKRIIAGAGVEPVAKMARDNGISKWTAYKILQDAGFTDTSKLIVSRLTKEQAIAIYNDNRKQNAIADAYGVSKTLVNNIKNGNKWASVTGAKKR